jgi:subtilase family serine protease
LLSTKSWVVVFGLQLLFSSGGLAGQEDRIRESIETNRSIRLHASVHPRTRLAQDTGALETDTAVDSVRLMLSQTDEQRKDLERFLEKQRDSSSSDYQNWLTPEQYGERFGVSENDLARIGSWLHSHGFTIEHVARARNWITFNGTAGQIARTFRTELHHFEVDGEAHFANATEVWIPASLDSIVSGVSGLDDFRLTPLLRRTALHPEFTVSNGSHYLSPDDLAVIYNIQALYDADSTEPGKSL